MKSTNADEAKIHAVSPESIVDSAAAADEAASTAPMVASIPGRIFPSVV
jgi:hypothetical protein